MRLTIFGATGQTGKPLVTQALDAGYEVIAFVRNPSKLDINHNHLKVVIGDVTNPDAVELAIQGSDAVISVLNTQNVKTKPITIGMQNILASMKKYGVRRLIMSASALSTNDPNDSHNLKYNMITGLAGFLVKLMFRFHYEDLSDSVQVVKASDIDWTVVRMPIPTNDSKPRQAKAGYVDKKTHLFISRINAASFMLNEIKESKYIKHTPVIFNL
jgi:uncharacterized protein YbjT (DUF2867 family)